MHPANTLEDLLLQLALIEDLGFPYHDITTAVLFPDDKRSGQARIISKHHEPVVVCGIDVMRRLLAKLATDCQIDCSYQDGDWLAPGASLLTIAAPAPALLQAERVALNFLRHLCAIATLTAKYVQRVASTPLKILDTRKTTPGFRSLEKYAVQCGGGVNHRMGLYDALMVKDTHVDMLGGMSAALAALPEPASHGLPVIVEVRTLLELSQVLEQAAHKVTRVLLDNMPPALLRDCVALVDGRLETEASGNVRLESILAIAETGVDYASVGELTYNAGHVDLSMYTRC